MGFSALTPPGVGQSTQASLWSFPLTQTSGGLLFRPGYRVKVGTSCTWGLTFTLLGWSAGQGGESGYTVDTEFTYLINCTSYGTYTAYELTSKVILPV